MKYNLSEIIEVIKNRRTIYPENFTGRVVQKEVIEKLLSSAIWAPTHGKTQPWRFKVFQDNGRLTLSDQLGETYKENYTGDSFNEFKYKKIKNRPLISSVVIAVCMKRDVTKKIPEIEEIEAVACAVQNMMLTATAYGIGSFWSTPKLLDKPEMKDFFQLEQDDKCLGLLYFGYTNEKWPSGQRKPIEYVTEWIN
ncbi:nitroreductase [Flavobacteriales bacterium]|nr:nitroreductase [Flavobacteriales bacterium]